MASWLGRSSDDDGWLGGVRRFSVTRHHAPSNRLLRVMAVGRRGDGKLVRRLRLVPPPDQLPPNLSVGDVVVYASYGIGRVEARTPEGAGPETITLSFASELVVTLPLARALQALRPLSGAAALEDVRRTLRAESAVTDEPWSRQYRLTREKVTSGRAFELAEVVRDGLRREQRQAAAGRGTMPPSERQLYLQARALLTAEVARSRAIEASEAEAWIVAQVGAPPAAPERLP